MFEKMNKKREFILVILITLICAGLFLDSGRGERRRERMTEEIMRRGREEVAKVSDVFDVTNVDGITHREASVIASKYNSMFVDGFVIGSSFLNDSDPDYWFLIVSVSGNEQSDIFLDINKHTGEISSAGLPTVTLSELQISESTHVDRIQKE